MHGEWVEDAAFTCDPGQREILARLRDIHDRLQELNVPQQTIIYGETDVGELPTFKRYEHEYPPPNEPSLLELVEKHEAALFPQEPDGKGSLEVIGKGITDLWTKVRELNEALGEHLRDEISTFENHAAGLDDHFNRIIKLEKAVEQHRQEQILTETIINGRLDRIEKED